MIEARCFGRSEIVAPGGQIQPSSELVFAFALYLCVRAGEHVPRAELVEMFWPQADEVRGRHNLRQMLYRLKEIGFTLDEDGELLSLNPLRVRCDLADAMRADWIIEAEESTIAAACDALPWLTRRFSERYGEWIDGVRARLESQFRRASLRVLSDAKSEGRWFDVEHWALMILRSDPLNETAILARAEGTAMLGSKAEAMAQLDRYLGELGPNAEKIGLPAKLLRRRIKAQAERREGEQVLPLVGREEEIRRVTEALYGREQMKPQGFFVYGPAGIGKTRLIEECAEIAELNGMTNVAIKLTERDIDTPNSILIALSHRLIGLRGSPGADPRALAIINRTKGGHNPKEEAPLTGSAAISNADIAWAVEQLLGAILEETRIVVSVDNVQHASIEDLALFSRTMIAQNAERLVWYLAGRDFPLLGSKQDLPPSLSPITPISVKPLSRVDAETLTQQVISSLGREATSASIDETIALAGGNPLFIQELARSVTDGRPRLQLPRTLQKTIGERLTTLTPEHLEICRLVCLLDAEATIHNLQALCSFNSARLTEVLPRLESEGILKAGRHGTVELHDCWRLAMQDEMSPLTKTLLTIKAADHISKSNNAPKSPNALSAAARLYAEGGDLPRAFSNYLLAGRLLYDGGLCAQALALFTRAEPFALSPEENLHLFTVKACTEHAMGDFRGAIASAQRGLKMRFAPNQATQDSQTTLTAVLADATWKAGNPYQDAMSRLETLVSLPALSPLARQHGCFLGLRLAYNSHASHTAEHFLKWSSRVTAPEHPTPFALLTRLVHFAERATTSEVISACETLRQSDISSLPVQYSLLLQRYVAQSLRWAGDYLTSINVAAAAFDESLRIGLLDEAAMIALQTAFTYLDLAKPEEALSWIEKAAFNSPAPRSHERATALRHAQSRFLLQTSQWAEAYELLLPELDTIQSDQTLRRRIAETSCIAFAAAKCGMTDIAIRCFESCLDFLRSDSPSLQSDFPISALYRTLMVVGKESEAKDFLVDYCHRRAKAYQRPVAPYFAEISAELGMLTLN